MIEYHFNDKQLSFYCKLNQNKRCNNKSNSSSNYNNKIQKIIILNNKSKLQLKIKNINQIIGKKSEKLLKLLENLQF